MEPGHEDAIGPLGGFELAEDPASERAINGASAQDSGGSVSSVAKIVGYLLVAAGVAAMLYLGLVRKQKGARVEEEEEADGRRTHDTGARSNTKKPPKPTRRDRKSGARYATIQQDDEGSSQSDDEFQDVS